MKTALTVGIGILLASAAIVNARPAKAQPYPSKPIQVVVGYGTGGASDLLARIVADKVAKKIGQSMVVVNRPGANSIVGTEFVARAAPDGYTLILGSSGLTVNPNFYENITYDPIKDFEPITLFATLPMVLVVNPAVPVTSMRDLVALAKARPGKFNFASAGNGSAPHLAGEMLKIMAGIDMVHVPYKGNGQAATDVMGGQIPFMFSPAAAIIQHVKSGRLKAIAVGANQRLEGLPDVPTTSESGYENFEVSASWIGYLAPAGTPKKIVSLLHKELTETLSDPDVKEKLTSFGSIPVGSTPAEFAAFLKEDLARWKDVIQKSGAHRK